MTLVLNLPADLEAIIRKRAEQAGLDIPAYVLQTLRVCRPRTCGEVIDLQRTVRGQPQSSARNSRQSIAYFR